MAVKTKDELINAIKTKLGNDTSDEALAILEDVSDTFSDLTKKSSDTTNWKEKYETNDAEWRQKYADRFSGKVEDDNDDNNGLPKPKDVETKKPTFDSLFEEK